MEDNPNNLALIDALNEMQKANTNVSKLFFFQGDRVLAKVKNVTKEEVNKTLKAFQELKDHSETVNGIEAITLQGKNARLDITQSNDYYLATVTSNEVNKEIMDQSANVIEPPTIEKAQETQEQAEAKTAATDATETVLSDRLGEIEQIIPEESKPAVELMQLEKPEHAFSDVEYSEFTVDSKGGIGLMSGSADVVRLDAITIGRWTELYGENKIAKIVIQEINSGKTVECQFEQIKDDNYDKAGVALVPEPILRALRIKKGTKILIKPLLSQETTKETIEESVSQEETQVQSHPEPLTPDSETCQLMVAEMSGFNALRDSNTVRFDQGLLERWRELYGAEKIENVEIYDTFIGKSVKCKFKIVKDEKFQGNGLIQIPKPIRQELEVKEGSLVIVKPIILRK